MVIDVVCALGPRSLEHIGFLKLNAETLKSPDCTLRWKVVRSGITEPTPDVFVSIGDVEQNKPPIMHGLALNAAIDHIETEYVLICDVDVAFLMKDWDQYMISLLNSSPQVAMVGSAYPTWFQHYQGFPNVTLAMFKTAVLKELRPDFVPTLNFRGNRVITRGITEEEAGFYSVSKKGLKRDTGWRLPQVFLSAGYTGVPMEVVYGMPGIGKLPFPFKDRKKEFMRTHMRLNMHEYHHNGNLFASHLGTSRDMGAKDTLTTMWRKRVNRYMGH